MTNKVISLQDYTKTYFDKANLVNYLSRQPLKMLSPEEAIIRSDEFVENCYNIHLKRIKHYLVINQLKF